MTVWPLTKVGHVAVVVGSLVGPAPEPAVPVEPSFCVPASFAPELLPVELDELELPDPPELERSAPELAPLEEVVELDELDPPELSSAPEDPEDPEDPVPSPDVLPSSVGDVLVPPHAAMVTRAAKPANPATAVRLRVSFFMVCSIGLPLLRAGQVRV